MSAAQLPRDVLLLVLAYVPINGRMRVIRLVCKRWEAATIHSIESLDATDHFCWMQNRDLLARMTGLTSWKSCSPPSAAIATRIEALHLHYYISFLHYRSFEALAQPISQLTALRSLVVCNNLPHDHINVLLRWTASTLTHLSVPCTFTGPRTLLLPSLRSLALLPSLEALGGPPDLGLLENHLSSLTSVDLSCISSQLPLDLLLGTSLRTLKVQAKDLPAALRISSLTSLEIDWVDTRFSSGRNIPPRHMTNTGVITSLRVEATFAGEAEGVVIALQLSNQLTSLSLGTWNTDGMDRVLHLLKTSLRDVSLISQNKHPLTLSLPVCECLTTNCVLASSWNLPKLRKLHIDKSAECTMAEILAVLQHCTTIENLSVERTFPAVASLREVEAILEFGSHNRLRHIELRFLAILCSFHQMLLEFTARIHRDMPWLTAIIHFDPGDWEL